MTELDDLVDKVASGDIEALRERIREIREDRKISKRSLTKRTERTENKELKVKKMLAMLSDEERAALLKSLETPDES